jgi:hypothetical protein
MFAAPSRYFDLVKETIEAIIHQIIIDMAPVEKEISDANKIRFLKLNHATILIQC